jgi:hypothetical protein
MDARLYDGSGQPALPQVVLRAGPLSLVYENGLVRYIRLGSADVLLMIYAAVRDHNWGTIPGRLNDEQIEAGPDSFRVQYRSEHVQNDIDFAWTGTITGTADGTITFRFDGEARSTFSRNRIGFCVLHPMSCAGKACTIRTVDGQQSEGRFPLHIAPHQPFKNLRAITHEVAPGVSAEVLMEGDTFEMEDQRNWIDASYKTYCTPLELPFPVTVEKGTKIVQTITLRLVGAASAADIAAAPLTFAVSREKIGPLPPLGLGVASHGQPPRARALDRLKSLNLSHLRADLRLSAPGWDAALRRAAAEAVGIGAKLEVAAHVSDEAAAELAALRALADELNAPVARWIVFHVSEKSTSAAWARLGREHLATCAGGTPVGAGTDAFFTELNRQRPPVDDLDFVVYSINPQVHAFDNASLVETLAAQAVTVTSAQQFSAGKPVIVSPVTFKMRWNPNATGPEPETPPGELPPQVDPRQASLFGAGWTAGSVRYLAEGGAAALTYYETTGWRGVMETEDGPPAPAKFPSVPGGVFPMYHVFAALGEFAGGDVLAVTASAPLTVDGIAVRKDGRLRALLANFTPRPQTVIVRGLAGTVSISVLDETSVERAMNDPDAFRAEPGQEARPASDGLPVTLLPYALARIDGAAT